jgi:hypothetical protein
MKHLEKRKIKEGRRSPETIATIAYCYLSRK